MCYSHLLLQYWCPTEHNTKLQYFAIPIVVAVGSYGPFLRLDGVQQMRAFLRCFKFKHISFNTFCAIVINIAIVALSAWLLLQLRFEVFWAVKIHIMFYCIISPCALLCRYQCYGGTHYHHLLIPHQTTDCNNPYNHDIYVLKLTSLKYTCFCGPLAGIVWYFLNVIMNMLMKQNIPQKRPYLNVYNDRKFISVDCTWWTVR